MAIDNELETVVRALASDQKIPEHLSYRLSGTQEKLKELVQHLDEAREGAENANRETLTTPQKLRLDKERAEVDKTIAEAEGAVLRARTDVMGHYPPTKLPALLVQTALAFFAIGDAAFLLQKEFGSSPGLDLFVPGLAWGVSLLLLFIGVLSQMSYERRQMDFFQRNAETRATPFFRHGRD